MSVEEVTLDFSESMHNIVETCFPKAMRTLDRFHHQIGRASCRERV